MKTQCKKQKLKLTKQTKTTTMLLYPTMTETLNFVGLLKEKVLWILSLHFNIWAAKKGYDFSFFGPFLLVSLIVVVLFVFPLILVHLLHFPNYLISFTLIPSKLPDLYE